MTPVSITAFYGTWLGGEEEERAKKNTAVTTKLNSRMSILYQAQSLIFLSFSDCDWLSHFKNTRIYK